MSGRSSAGSLPKASARPSPRPDGVPSARHTGGAELRIEKSFSPAVPRPGRAVTYTITVTNPGTAVHPGATVVDDLAGVLDDAVFNDDASASSGSVSFSAPRVAWTGDVAAGQTVTITYSVTAGDPPAGNRRLAGLLVGPEGSNCETGSADPACGNLDAPGLPLLYVLMTADRETVRPGGTVSYTITATNLGAAAYPGARLTGDLSRTLDDARYNGDARATSGDVSLEGTRLVWEGDVPVGATVEITYSVTADDPDTGDRLLDSGVQAHGGGTNCPDPVPWSARIAGPVPGADPGCSQRIAVEGVTIRKPEGRDVGVAPDSDCPMGSADPDCAGGPNTIVRETARHPAPVPPPGRVPAQADVTGSAHDHDQAHLPEPVCTLEFECVPESEPAPRVPPAGMIQDRPFPFPSPVGPAGPTGEGTASRLPFTGPPLGPASAGLLLLVLGLAVRLGARRGVWRRSVSRRRRRA
ncbi:putative repeat protein (TIGR01451 family) [Streptosporangium becharense]|uniref:Putative repeat protein (TIGR01451 family) n=1 Tax=Streptosporangium becharense TaxID=1816182 RepID=A0A7W9IH05_9ACTN|nr:DUF11 domain-containing protein [Streptosporangium becharense]MBB2912638.1 putative repeat protein (TIGR01451 family) [Streptosporangium becharense]MBB5820533.1 putative repeat protein (TIGR01451 family) [Streptosporangium becharense]